MGWKTVTLLIYRIGLLLTWTIFALPGVILNGPVFITAGIISKEKARRTPHSLSLSLSDTPFRSPRSIHRQNRRPRRLGDVEDTRLPRSSAGALHDLRNHCVVYSVQGRRAAEVAGANADHYVVEHAVYWVLGAEVWRGRDGRVEVCSFSIREFG